MSSAVFRAVASIWVLSHVTLGSGFCPPAAQVSACISGLAFRPATLTHAPGFFWCQIPAPGGPPPPSPVLCVSSLQPTSRETSVSPSLSVATLLGALVNTVSVNVCVAGSGCLLPSVWKLTEGRGYGQFCSQPCSCRTWCLMTIYSV